MKWQQITITTARPALPIIANRLSDLGIDGIEIQDSLAVNRHIKNADWGYVDIPLKKATEEVKIIFWLEETSDSIPICTDIETLMQKLATKIAVGIAEIDVELVDESEWKNQWKKYFHTTHIGKNLVIKPSWEDYVVAPEEIVLELDPGCAFGTGTHATTSMCLTFLEKYLQSGMRVFDVGTGSGILAIAAAKLGAKEVLAADYDANVLPIIRDNVVNNMVEEQIKIFQSDILKSFCGKADFIVANIVADIIMRLLPEAKKHLHKQGMLLVSGIIGERLSEVETGIHEQGFYIYDFQRQDGWVAMVLKFKE